MEMNRVEFRRMVQYQLTFTYSDQLYTITLGFTVDQQWFTKSFFKDIRGRNAFVNKMWQYQLISFNYILGSSCSVTMQYVNDMHIFFLYIHWNENSVRRYKL